jgi:hypothetical protein
MDFDLDWNRWGKWIIVGGVVVLLVFLWSQINQPWRGSSSGKVLAEVEGQPVDPGDQLNADGSPQNRFAQIWLSHRIWKYQLIRREDSKLVLRVFHPDKKVGEFDLAQIQPSKLKNGLVQDKYDYRNYWLGQ